MSAQIARVYREIRPGGLTSYYYRGDDGTAAGGPDIHGPVRWLKERLAELECMQRSINIDVVFEPEESGIKCHAPDLFVRTLPLSAEDQDAFWTLLCRK